MTFADHFSKVATQYAAYRPRYPHALAELLADRCRARGLAWDAGCGNGQLSVSLARRFGRVIATDPAQRADRRRRGECARRVPVRAGRGEHAAGCERRSRGRRAGGALVRLAAVRRRGRAGHAAGSAGRAASATAACTCGQAGADRPLLQGHDRRVLAEGSRARRQLLSRSRVAVAGGRRAGDGHGHALDSRRAARLHRHVVGDAAADRGGRTRAVRRAVRGPRARAGRMASGGR